LGSVLSPRASLAPLASRPEQAVTLRQWRKVSLGDALVAGIVLAHGLTLATRNVEDLQWIQGLSLLNPFDTTPPQEHEHQG
jgi:hypothetical protein